MSSLTPLPSDWEITWFKQFLRFNTAHPTPNYRPTVEWLRERAKDLDMSFSVVEIVPENPVAILTKLGTDPTLPAVGYNCHVDVVPVEEGKWSALPKGVTPFDAWEDPKTGNIYARGSQDMKIVGAGFMCAMRRLLEKGVQLKRTVHFVMTPDEEVGSTRGMAQFILSEQYKALNIGVMVDEGLATEADEYLVFYAERHPWWGVVTAESAMGHGSNFNEEPSSVVKIMEYATFLNQLHQHEFEGLKATQKDGEYFSINITMFKAGVTKDGGKTYQYNQIPGEATIGFDMRVPFAKYDEAKLRLEREAARLGLNLNWLQLTAKSPPSPIGPNAVWHREILKTIEQCGVKAQTRVFPAATDSRYVRSTGVPAYGFSPMRKTTKLLHDHNEYVSRATFLEAVAVYEKLLTNLGNVTSEAATSKM